ncbi:MAG: hypothetical protein Q8Q60_02330 [Candidatus Chromulinivorax sp.]|nr:hypothetical protein [Candidatus Chromulinivorax sp.]
MNKNFKICSLLFIASMQLTQLINASGIRAARAAQSQGVQNDINITDTHNPMIPQEPTSNIVTLPPLTMGTSQRRSMNSSNSLNPTTSNRVILQPLANVNHPKKNIVETICTNGTVNLITGILTANMFFPSDLYRNKRRKMIADIDLSNKEAEEKRKDYQERRKITKLKMSAKCEAEMLVFDVVKIGLKQATTTIKAKRAQENCFVQK